MNHTFYVRLIIPNIFNKSGFSQRIKILPHPHYPHHKKCILDQVGKDLDRPDTFVERGIGKDVYKKTPKAVEKYAGKDPEP